MFTSGTNLKRPGEPRPKKAHQVRSNVKVLLTVFFDYRGVVHQEFLPYGRTVNKEYYLEVMRRLQEAIRRKRPEMWKNNSWLLHHDNAPAHSSLLVRDFLAKNNTTIMPQPPYSPDLASCDFFSFPKLKRPMKGRRFTTIEEIKTASLEELKRADEEAAGEEEAVEEEESEDDSVELLSRLAQVIGMGYEAAPNDNNLLLLSGFYVWRCFSVLSFQVSRSQTSTISRFLELIASFTPSIQERLCRPLFRLSGGIHSRAFFAIRSPSILFVSKPN